MKNNKILFASIIVISLLITAYASYQFGINKNTSSRSNSITKNASNVIQKSEKKVLYWHDPMVPAQRFDKPGPSPFMDMDLVPVYASGANEDAGGNNIFISHRVQQNLGIRTTEVVLGNLSSNIMAVGSVAYNESDVDVIQARNAGYIEKLLVREPLVKVKKGQALAQIYVPQWIAAQEELLTVMRLQKNELHSLPTGLLEGAKQRMRLVGMNEEQISLIESSGKLHPRITITAPRSGVITELSVSEGMTVNLGASLFRINGLHRVWINADVPENLLSKIRSGYSVDVSTSSLPGAIFKAKVSHILPELNPSTRTLKVRIEMDNAGEKLLPGMFATLQFNTLPRQDVMLIPSEAVIKTGTRNVVMLALGEGRFSPVEIRTGAENSTQIEVLQGLSVGQKIVISGQFLIDSEASLKATETRTSTNEKSETKMEMKQ
jgi:Cu(I)/Ag(I) efflux system membrane fusion protein